MAATGVTRGWSGMAHRPQSKTHGAEAPAMKPLQCRRRMFTGNSLRPSAFSFLCSAIIPPYPLLHLRYLVRFILADNEVELTVFALQTLDKDIDTVWLEVAPAIRGWLNSAPPNEPFDLPDETTSNE
ncbi:hypothetical protein F4802DRAFT_514266 [Xylaria palmicola]|nr:hypothetical protein F4802DRAFT_514266 [Xylaria palmicola]